MAKRIVLGGLLGGVMAFLMGSFFHMATHLGETGIRNLPSEDNVVGAMRTSIHEPGLYFFPGMDMSKRPTDAEQAAYLEKYQQGPTGILIFSPGGEGLQFGKRLFNQFLFVLVAALIVALILGITASSTTFATRVLIAVLIAVFAGTWSDLPYWNWYNFPTNYTCARILEGMLTWGVAGLGMAAVVKRPAA